VGDLQTYGIKSGIKVAEVLELDNPATRVGVRVGDIVVQADNKPFTDPYLFNLYVTHLLPYHTIQLNVMRDHASLTFFPELWELPVTPTVTPPTQPQQPDPGQKPPAQPPPSVTPPPVPTPPSPQLVQSLGIWVVPVTDEAAFKYGFARGAVPSSGLLVTKIEPGSEADSPDLIQIGNIIIQAGQHPVATAADLAAAPTETDGGVILEVVRPDTQTRYVELTP
jgi:S1-C subfamily serine protease